MHRDLMITERRAKTFFSTLLCLWTTMFFVSCSVVKRIDIPENGLLLSGKIFIVFEGESLSLRYSFAGVPGDGLLNIRSAVGLSQTLIQIKGRDLLINDPKTKKMSRYSNQMIQREFGFFMPFEAMTYWIRGKPEPREETRMISSNSEGDLVSFEQFGWRVFIDYLLDNQEQNSPKRVKASFGENEVIVTVDS